MMPGYRAEPGDGQIHLATEQEINAQLQHTTVYQVLTHIEDSLECSQDEVLGHIIPSELNPNIQKALEAIHTQIIVKRNEINNGVKFSAPTWP